MKKTICKIFLTILIAILGVNLSAQTTGKVAGIVKSNGDNTTCMFAKIIITNGIGFLKRSSTDMDGKFNISNLDTGVYNISIIYLNHDTLKAILKVSGAEVIEKVYNLDPKVKTITATKVTGAGLSGSSSRGLTERKNEAGMKDIITADAIAQSPGTKDAGDVLKKLTGASIQDNKFAVIRGLSDRYNFAIINGAPLPSSEADKKAFSFDMFPSSQLESMSINKTATPDMPSEFAGGVITLKTRDIPLQKVFSVGLSLGYHNLTTFQDVNTYTGGKRDFLGFDDGTRALPSGTPNSKDYINLINNKSDLVPVSQQFSPTFGSKTKNALPNLGFDINFAKPFKIGRREAGFNFSTVYKNSQKYTETINRNYGVKELQTDFLDKVSNQSVFIGSMLNFTYKLNDANRIGFKTLVNINSEDQTILRSGTDVQAKEQVRATALYYQQNNFVSSQLIGKHGLRKGAHSLDWNIGYSRISKTIPDFRRIRYQRPVGSEDEFTIAIPPSPNPDFGGRFYSDLTENVVSANYDYLMKDILKISPKFTTNLKIGGFHQIRQREFNARVFGYVRYKTSAYDNNISTQGPNDIYSSNNMGRQGFILQESTNKSDEYNGNSTLHAGYGMFDHNLFKKLRLIYGARVESFNQQLNSFKAGSGDEVKINTDKVDVLPSVNLNYSFTDNTNIRLAASKTLSRPEFRELAPFSFYDFAKSIEVAGNPDLKRTSIQNYDLRVEHYFASNQLISVSGFYKIFTNPIEQVTGSDISGGTVSTSYANALSAKNYGFEVEFKRNLSFLLKDAKLQYKDWKNHMYFYANYAWIRSEVDVTNVAGAYKRPLQGQSPYVVNTGLNYNNPENLLSGGASFNRVGKRIVFVGTDIYPDFYENPRSVIDAQFSMKMAKSGKRENLVAKVQFNDILAQKIIIYQNQLADGTEYKPGTSREMRVTNPGRSISISISYKF